MPAIKIHNKEYQINCAPGEEERLKVLAARLNERLSINAKNFNGASDSLLMVLTALLLEDMVEEMQDKYDNLVDNTLLRLEKIIDKAK